MLALRSQEYTQGRKRTAMALTARLGQLKLKREENAEAVSLISAGLVSLQFVH
jgi:hypothetical protein